MMKYFPFNLLLNHESVEIHSYCAELTSKSNLRARQSNLIQFCIANFHSYNSILCDSSNILSYRNHIIYVSPRDILPISQASPLASVANAALVDRILQENV